MPSPIVRIDNSATALTNDDLITFDGAVRWLRAQGVQDQRSILESLQAAVNELERRCNRTFRQTVTRTVYYCGWMYKIRAPFPPLVSVSSVKYSDTDSTLQTVPASDYSVRISSDSVGWVEFPRNHSFAALDLDSAEPVQIEMVTGPASTQVPLVALQVVRLLTIANHDHSDKHRATAYGLIAGASLIHRG